MPTYEYRCDEGHEFEAFQKMSDDPLDECPECGASASRKISSGAGLVFKGSGFYITDYGKSGQKKPAEAKSEGGKSDGGGSEAKSSGAGSDSSAKKSGDKGSSAD